MIATGGAVQGANPSDGGAGRGKAAYRYKAFISYRHTELDRRLAHWLHAAIEKFRTPRRMVNEGVGRRVGVVFRDEEELSASSDLGGAIEAALEASEFLIVICSPRTPASRWVNEEVTRFRQLGRETRILACLIEGEPADAFPPALGEVRSTAAQPDGREVDLEPLAADFRAANGLGRRAKWRIAKLKLVATLLGCRFDDLVVREQARRRWMLFAGFAAMSAIVVVIAVSLVVAVEQRRNAVMQRDAALLTQSRFLTDLSRQRTEAGDGALGVLLALEALPRNLAEPDRPYHPPAMTALASATGAQRELLTLGLEPADGAPVAAIMDAVLSVDGNRLLVGAADGSAAVWDIPERRRVVTMKVAAEPIFRVAFDPDGQHVWAATGKRLYQGGVGPGQEASFQAVEVTADADVDAAPTEEGWVDLVFRTPADGGRPRVVSVERTHRTRLWTPNDDGWVGHPPVDLVKGLVDWRAISPGGRSAASGSGHTDEVVVFNLESGAERARLGAAELGDGTGSVAGVFANRSDRLLVSRDYRVMVWDLAAGRVVASLIGHRDSVLRVAISPDDSLIATGSEDGTVRLWSSDDNFAAPVASFDGFVRGSLAFLFRGPEIAQVLLRDNRMRDDFEPAVTHLAFSADGRRLLAVSGDRSITVFDVARRRAIARVSGHTGRLDRAAIAAGGTLAASVGREGTARVWRTEAAPVPVEFLHHDGMVQTVVITTQGGAPVLLVNHSNTTCGGLWRAWQVDTAELLEPPVPRDGEDRHDLGSVSIDGRSSIAGSSRTGAFSIRNLSTGGTVTLQASTEKGPILCAYVAPGGRMVRFRHESGDELQPVPGATGASGPARDAFAAGGNLGWSLSKDGVPRVAALEAQLDLASSKINRDGTRLLVRQADDNAALYDLANRRLIRLFARPSDAAEVTFSDAGTAILGSTASAVRVWNAADGKLIHETAVDAAPAFVALGGTEASLLVVADGKGGVGVTDLRAGDKAVVLAERFAAPVAVAIDPGGSRAIVQALERDCSDVAPSLWDLRTNRKIASFPVTQGCPYRFAFSPDGSEVVGAVSEPFRIALWESTGGARLAEFDPCRPGAVEMFDGDPTQVTAVGFSDDGRLAYGGTLAGAVCVWPNPGAGPALVARARASVPRSLTWQERERFFLSADADVTTGARGRGE